MNSGIFAISPTDIRHQASSTVLGTSIDIGVDCLDSVEGTSTGHTAEGDIGVTVITVPDGAIDAADIRDGGPDTRETDLFTPEDTVERAHVVVLADGSVYGLAAADRVMRELRDYDIGFRVTPTRLDILVPIVPNAIIFDLLLGKPTLPIAGLGREALSHALDDVPEGTPPGTANAGVGVMAGAIKGGFGQARVTPIGGRYFVVAVMVANSFGVVIDPEGCFYGIPATTGASEEALVQLDRIFVGRTKILADAAGDGESSASTRNTIIGTVIINVSMTTAQLKRLAMCGHDGLVWAIRPAHVLMDGGTLFALSSARAADGGNAEPMSSDPVVLLAVVTVDVVQMAIVGAVMSTTRCAEVAVLLEMLDK